MAREHRGDGRHRHRDVVGQGDRGRRRRQRRRASHACRTRCVVPAPERFEHDAAERVARRSAPRAGGARRPRRPRRERGRDGAVAHRGRRAGHAAHARACSTATSAAAPASCRRQATDDASGGFLGYVRWLHETVPTAHGFWPAQSVANHALAGEAVLDTTTASLAHPLFDFTGWDAAVAGELGITTDQLPRLVPTGWECGQRRRRRSRARVGVHRRDGRAAGGGRRPAPATCSCCSAPRSSCGSSPHEGAEVPGYVDHPAHRVGQLPRGRPEQRRRAVPRLGHAVPGGTGRASRSIPARSRCGRRTRAASGCRSTTTTRRASLHRLDLTHDAGRDRACHRRGVGVRGEARDRRRGRARRRAAEARRRLGWRHARRRVGRRPSPTSPTCRSTAWRCPRAARSGRRGWRASPPGSRSRWR